MCISVRYHREMQCFFSIGSMVHFNSDVPVAFLSLWFLVADRKSYRLMKTEGFRRQVIATHLQVIECLRVASFCATNVQRVTAHTCVLLKTTWALNK